MQNDQVHVVVQYSCAVFMTVLDVHQRKEYKEKNYAALLPPCGIVGRRTLFYYLCVQKCKKRTFMLIQQQFVSVYRPSVGNIGGPVGNNIC